MAHFVFSGTIEHDPRRSSLSEQLTHLLLLEMKKEGDTKALCLLREYYESGAKLSVCWEIGEAGERAKAAGVISTIRFETYKTPDPLVVWIS